MLNGFWRYRYLLWNLVSRDFKLKYRRSVLGVLWSVLNPLLMCLVYWAVFSSLMDMRGSGIDNFPVFLMCGQLLFNFFNEATSASMSSVLSAAPLLKKVYIPKYIFPLEKCCFAMVNCVFSFVALLLVMIFTGAPFHLTLIEAVYPLVTLFFFSLGVGLLLAAATVFFRDIMHIWSVFITALLYFSAIFYDPTQMTFSIGGFNMQQIIKLNPMYWYITGFRRTVMWGIPLDFNMFAVCGCCAVLSMLVGGLGELMRYHGGISWLLERVNGLARKLSAESPVKAGECCISLLVLLANLCTANNTVAIILTGKVAHEIAVSNGVDRRRSASLLDIFSCVVQGLIPYGAQLLLAGSIAKLSPLSIAGNNWYCMLLAVAAVFAILFGIPRVRPVRPLA